MIYIILSYYARNHISMYICYFRFVDRANSIKIQNFTHIISPQKSLKTTLYTSQALLSKPYNYQ